MKKLILLSLAVLFTMTSVYAQQSRKITGKVTDIKTGEELIGVNVSVKGVGKGVITNLNGSYSIEVTKSTDILVFSYVGYVKSEKPVPSKNELNIQLSENNKELSEVVVVGYGTQKKESIVGSISSINNKAMVTAPATNITQSLAGRLSGIQVVQSSGEIGNDVADIVIRGTSTWNSTTPLYVVDGIIREEFAKIDPNEIETFNVLKDASATAVYGVKGANGVIIVTTKRGVSGKAKVSITANSAVTQPINIPRPLGAYDAASLSYLQSWGQYKTITPVAKGGTLAYDLALWRTGASPWTHSDVDWIGNVMKESSTLQQYNMNVSGGTKTVRYFVSGGFLVQNGFYKNDDLTKNTRFNFRNNLDIDITKTLTAALTVGARIENLNSPATTAWSSWNIYRAAFAVTGRKNQIYNPNGSYSGTGNNIVKSLKESGVFKNVTSSLQSSLSLNQKLDFIVKGLSAKVQVAYDNQAENARQWNHASAEYMYDQLTNSYQKFGEDQFLSYAGAQKSWNWTKFYYEGGLMYNRSFDKHSLTGLFLGNRSEYIENAKPVYAVQGIVGRATYDFDKRYFFEVNVGRNGSENFPSYLRYGTFPAFAAGWMISNEKFISESKIGSVLTSLKLRTSLGWVGNDRPFVDGVERRHLFLQDYSKGGGYMFGTGDNYYDGIRQGDIANYNVTWETARKFNIGFESDFYNGLFGLNFDFFHEFRKDILTGNGPIRPEYVGAAFMPANIGELSNKGFEIEFKHNKTVSKDFNYSVKGNFTYNVNKVLKRTDPSGLLPYQKAEGFPIGTPLMYKHIGYFESYEEIQNSPSQLAIHNGLPSNVEVVPGDLKFLDFNNDGVINQADAYRQGYGTTPEMQYGLTLSGKWKSFDFSVLFQGSTKSLFMKYWEIMWAFSNNDNVFEKHNNYWAPEIADEAQFTRFYGKSWVNNERYFSTYEAGNGTYLRLKSVEIGYDLPKKIIKKVLLSNARLYFSAINPYMLWKVEKYVDSDNRDSRGGKMPATRAFNIGLNLNF